MKTQDDIGFGNITNFDIKYLGHERGSRLRLEVSLIEAITNEKSTTALEHLGYRSLDLQAILSILHHMRGNS